MGHFLDHGYDLSYVDGELGISLWQHILEIFLIPSVYSLGDDVARVDVRCTLCGSIDFSRHWAARDHMCYDCQKATDDYQSRIIQFLEELLKRRSVSFHTLISTRFECFDSSVTLLDFITTAATSEKYKVYKKLLHRTAQMVSKYYHQYCAKMTTEQISALLYLTVAQISKLVNVMVDACFEGEKKNVLYSYPYGVENRKGSKCKHLK